MAHPLVSSLDVASTTADDSFMSDARYQVLARQRPGNGSLASNPSGRLGSFEPATVGQRPSLAESAEGGQKLAGHSSMGTRLETMPFPDLLSVSVRISLVSIRRCLGHAAGQSVDDWPARSRKSMSQRKGCPSRSSCHGTSARHQPRAVNPPQFVHSSGFLRHGLS